MKNYFITSKIGYGETGRNGFNSALFNFEVTNYNLIKFGSTFLVGIISLNKGTILHTTYATSLTNDAQEFLSAAIAVGITGQY